MSLGAVVALTTIVLSCGGGGETTEEGNPVGASTPTAEPTSTPVPTSTPWVCPLGKGTGTGECPKPKRADAELFKAMQNAIGAVENRNPDWFVFHKDGTVQIYDEYRHDFFDEVVDELNSMGYCALNDAHGVAGDGLEIAVKRNNDFNEQYKPWATRGWIRTDDNMFVAQCRPAWF